MVLLELHGDHPLPSHGIPMGSACHFVRWFRQETLISLSDLASLMNERVRTKQSGMKQLAVLRGSPWRGRASSTTRAIANHCFSLLSIYSPPNSASSDLFRFASLPCWTTPLATSHRFSGAPRSGSASAKQQRGSRLGQGSQGGICAQGSGVALLHLPATMGEEKSLGIVLHRNPARQTVQVGPRRCKALREDNPYPLATG